VRRIVRRALFFGAEKTSPEPSLILWSWRLTQSVPVSRSTSDQSKPK
jgi:hypothetical protein